MYVFIYVCGYVCMHVCVCVCVCVYECLYEFMRVCVRKSRSTLIVQFKKYLYYSFLIYIEFICTNIAVLQQRRIHCCSSHYHGQKTGQSHRGCNNDIFTVAAVTTMVKRLVKVTVIARTAYSLLQQSLPWSKDWSKSPWFISIS